MTVQTLGSGRVNVVVEQGSPKTLQLLSMDGQLIESVKTDQNHTFSAPKSGVYIITLSTDNQTQSIKHYIQ